MLTMWMCILNVLEWSQNWCGGSIRFTIYLFGNNMMCQMLELGQVIWDYVTITELKPIKSPRWFLRILLNPVFNFLCFSLVVQLARDLQKDFYTHLDKFFPVICNILSTHSKSWETLEQAFSCLSYLFKFLWRKMINDMKKVIAV